MPFILTKNRNKAWDSFINLGQINNWNPTVIKYHIGYLKPKYFELEKEKLISKNKIIKCRIKNISNALEIVATHTTSSGITLRKKSIKFND